ncbi:monovalent cation/H+ antiporter complex subunit F [Thalassotalea ganghwensis]
MTPIYATVCVAILVVMAIALARAFYSTTVYDRILGVNMFGTKTVLFIATVGYLMGRPDFLDIAIVYALINFIGMVAVLRFFEYIAPID